ncbi:unnamed protein product [Rotaria socialis]|uniref:Uncharacterized protein n=2 Tax=Rotaria socialis TaxID=392032 RepID=A0A817W7R3_9BILA|nr:unnamed protein product [Rotaria socialis]
MRLYVCMMFLLMIPCWVSADELTVSEAIIVLNGTVLILAIAFVSIGAIVSLVAIAYFISKRLKKQIYEPQYYIEETTITEKDGKEYYEGNNNIDSQVLNIHQIRPILSVSHVVSSITQALTNLTLALIPSQWLFGQFICNQEMCGNEKTDLPV